MHWAGNAAFYFCVGGGDSPLTGTGCVWLPGCCPAGVALKGVVWEDVAQQGQYGYPAPEAVCGERGGLLTGCLTLFFFFPGIKQMDFRILKHS